MRYETVTDASGPDIISRAVDVFGPGGHGLRLTDRGLLTVRFESPLGHVLIEATRTGNGRSEVTFETREYDREVQMFITSLPRHSALRRFFRIRVQRR